MRQLFTGLCVFMFGANILMAEFTEDFQSAKKLYDSDKYAEAEKAFTDLSGTADGKVADMSLQYAAYAAARQKKDIESLAFADRIKDKNIALLTKMNLLLEKRKTNEVIELSKDEDFEKWPDSIISNAFYCRGKAYLFQRNDMAEKDFLAALQHTVSNDEKNNIYFNLATYYKYRNDNQKLLGVYDEILGLKGNRFSTLCKIIIEKANLLASEGNSEAALSALDKFDYPEKKIQTNFYAQVLACHAEIAERIGKKDIALAKYKEIIAIPNAPAPIVENAKKKIDAIGSPK